MSDQYRSVVVSVGELPGATVDNMAALYLRNFDGSSPELFRHDLAEKDEILLVHRDDELVGFSALKFFARTWRGRRIRIVYSGDTIVSPEHWGQQRLAFDWLSRVGRYQREQPATPLYWFLLVKGHRTFRYLSIFSRRFFPHWSVENRDLKSLADQLAGERFAEDYRPETGVVEFRESRGHLRDALADADSAELAKPAVRFFFERNPGYRAGNELVCVCELAVENLKPLAARLFLKGVPDAMPLIEACTPAA